MSYALRPLGTACPGLYDADPFDSTGDFIQAFTDLTAGQVQDVARKRSAQVVKREEG